MANNLDYIKPSLLHRLPDYHFMTDIKMSWRGIVDKKEKYLPKEPNETNTKYDARWQRATYENFYSPCIDGIKGLVFKKPIKFNEDTPKQILDIKDNFNGQGDSFNIFAGDLFELGLDKGIAFALVNMTGSSAESRAYEIANNIRPYVTMIMPENVTSWKTDIVNGLTVLTQVKIREWVEVDVADNSYATEYEEHWRVLQLENNKVFYALYDENGTIKQEGDLGNINFIPLFAFYTAKRGYFESDIPFYDLAKLNIAHYNIFSDSRYSAHTASIPFYHGAGIRKEEVEDAQISPNTFLTTSDPSSKISIVDYDGKGVAVNETLLQRIERRIYQLGFSVTMTDKDMTATESIIEGQQKQSKLNTWVADLKDTLENILDAMAIMGGYGETGETGGTIEIDADILSTPITPEELGALTNAVTNGFISQQTAWEMIAQNSLVFPSDWDNEVEKERINSDGLLDSGTIRD